MLFLMATLADEERELIGDVELALTRAGISHKAAALDMQIDLSLWTRQRHGDGHISLKRLARLPEGFWREFIALRADRYGVTVLPTGS
uniref:XRE family transcriptional regulator n=1 Tax=viral metagenome TaxID=1070528 RepID=A0A6M3J9C7_9ZZZZ